MFHLNIKVMKRNSLFSVLMAVVITALIFTSCGSSKSAQSDSGSSASRESTLGQRREKSPAQIYAEDPERTNMRAWGMYNGFPDQNLESLAAATARATLADEISVLVKNAVDRYENTQRINNRGLNGQAESVMTSESQAQNDIQTVSKELIAGSRDLLYSRRD